MHNWYFWINGTKQMKEYFKSIKVESLSKIHGNLDYTVFSRKTVMQNDQPIYIILRAELFLKLTKQVTFGQKNQLI